jgi:hypothetical protein
MIRGSDMVSTPADVGLIAKSYAFVRKYAGLVFTIGKRIATLEQRVSDLEARLSKQPPNACPYCGEREMRKTYESTIQGDDRNQSRIDVWTCKACNETEKRVVRF